MTDSPMTSNKPYLVRALHEWISDNGCTPYLYVNTQLPDVHVPAFLSNDNPLVLSASYNACKDLTLENDHVSFQARFSGEVHDVYLPMASIIAIVARENGQGMTFEWDEETADAFDDAGDAEPSDADTVDAPSQDNKAPARKSSLKVVR